MRPWGLRIEGQCQLVFLDAHIVVLEFPEGLGKIDNDRLEGRLDARLGMADVLSPLLGHTKKARGVLVVLTRIG